MDKHKTITGKFSTPNSNEQVMNKILFIKLKLLLLKEVPN